MTLIPTLSPTLSPTMVRALKALADHGGEGIIDKNGHILAAGEVLGDGQHSPYSGMTWLRLMTLGEIEPAGPLRVRLPQKAAP